MKKKSDAFLRFIIGYKAIIGIIELALSINFLKSLDSDVVTTVKKLAYALNLNADHRVIGGLIKQAGMLGTSAVFGITMVVLIFGIFNIVEACGLYLRQRWAEWLTVIATALLIPFELYYVIMRITLVKAAVLVINCAIVYYLARHKELFKKRSRAVSLKPGGP
ncbi:MAG: DUF2127 domain-containing protein [Deltaproteobacteria bacterium]|nr:DUF2127 domain-containing protein [Deltaproteobacteria bacterium]